MMKDAPFTRLGLLLFICLWLSAALGLLLVPAGATVPIHWDFRGEPDLFAPGWLSVLLLPLVAAFVALVVLAVLRLMPEERTKPGRHLLDAAVSGAFCLLLVIQCALIAIGMGINVDMPKITAPAVGGLLLVIGNSLPKSQPNHIGGLRLPWTLRDPRNWQITHRWTGRLMVFCGALLLLFGLLLPTPSAAITATLLGVLAPILAGIAISILIAVRSRTTGQPGV
ncbi:MAG: SdpI family protein [Pseudomonadota bacterium]